MTTPTPTTVKTRFMIISDTHSYEFGKNKKFETSPFQLPTAKCDVLLHCSDLTMNGELEKLEGVVDMLSKIDAEVKLVIAGNHDRTMDGPHWRKYCGADIPHNRDGISSDPDDDDFADHAKALSIMTSPNAKKAGITYLEEGLHTITLQNGTTFTIYASPYQPEFCGYAFPYERTQDRFNPPEHILDGITEIPGVKVPDFPNVDVMMTHGPPKGFLDVVREGRLEVHVGCEALMTACSRARPRLYCFGHIHEGYGARVVRWKEGREGLVGKEAVEGERDLVGVYPEILDVEVEVGRETLMLNAAIMDVNYWPRNVPWVVDLELPRA